MDRQLLERMIGAGVLVVALVVIGPAILDGQRDTSITQYSDVRPGHSDSGVAGGTTAKSDLPAPEMRTHTIVLDREPERPPVARPVSESVAAVPPPQAEPQVEPPAAVAAAPEKQPKAAPVAKPAPAPPPAASPVSSGWSVQLGSFSERPNAERLANEVETHGFRAYLEPLKQPDRTFYRVRVGPRNTRDEAAELAGRLAKAGYTGQVTPQQALR
jgi:DedD protein